MHATFWAGKRVAVTGGAGFLGHYLVLALQARGADVRILDVRPGPLADVATHLGDVRDGDFVRTALSGCDVIFHTAGTVAAWGKELAAMHAIHREGTRNVLAAAGTARVVHTSSIVAVGAARGPRALDEESPFNLGQVGVPYIEAKYQAEQVAWDAARYGQDVVIVNPAYLIGPDEQDRSIVGRLCQRFWSGRVVAAPPGGLNLVDVRDVAEGHLLAAERGQAARRYILGNEDHSYHSFLTLLAQVADMRPRWLPTMPWLGLAFVACLAEVRGWWTGREPYPSLGHARLNRWFFYVSSERARSELGYAPRPVEESLRDAYRSHREQGHRGPRGVAKWWMRAA